MTAPPGLQPTPGGAAGPADGPRPGPGGAQPSPATARTKPTGVTEASATSTATATRTVQVADEPTWRRLPREAGRRVLAVNRLLGVSPAGWTLLVVAALAFWAGGRLGWAELRIASVACLVVLLLAVLFTLGRQSYAVSLELQSRRVVVGERAFGELRVENTSDRRLWPARIELPVGRRLASFGLPSLGGRASHDEVFAVPTVRRSVIRVGPARTVRGDPFRLMGREILWTDAIDLYVHPRTVPLPGRQGGFIRDLEGQPTGEVTNSDINFHALREYVPGDDRRYVHWRSTARTGTLMVRQFEETRRSHVAVALDVAGEDYLSDDEFELAVSVAGSISLQSLRDENTLSLLTSTQRLKAISPRRTLDELCGVSMVNRGTLPGLVRTCVRTVPGASVAVVVTGSQPAPADLRRACTLFDLDVRVLAVRIQLGAETSTQTLSNVTVLTLGSLDALPPAVRRASL
ncbi:DUF58 domain-containing protein [Auraticoccus sp. F435]|uniref:DUF58 domain-containing protein n=1 Tax=Auraticoccus cholistanensis TaxID=2656650 RepID=A0A6A9UUM3_9ACTN|nr:DUF58 domain-containing protein [Auraticoccus cholistanensis]MVA75274.1 DUF58 domain-containing protein [Auraticoccus cholistanensis]